MILLLLIILIIVAAGGAIATTPLLWILVGALLVYLFLGHSGGRRLY